MREIKFRAWDGHSMARYQMLSITMNGQLEYDGGSMGVSPIDYPLMQFTGLTDKNGVEIYEGDIVSFNNNRSNKTYTDVIKWAPFDKLAGFQVESPMIDIFDGTIEVIGNIHENPELLCAKK